MVIRKASRLVASFVVTSRGAGSLTTTSLVVGRLNDPSLLDWNKAPASSSSFAVYDPASPNTVLAEVQGVDTREAIEKSKNALGSWRDDTTASFRSACLLEWSRLLKSNSEDLATIMTLESGKPLAESRGEVNYAASFLDYYAAEAIRSTGAGGGFMVPSPFATPSGGPKGNVLAVQQAVGVCALITPWNFPMAMITRKAGPALAVGCTAIVKPSELTPLSAIALENLAIQAGIPSDVFQVVTTSTEETPRVGELLATSPHIQKLSFTGSTRVGKLLMKQSSETMKRLSLELGGNAPFIVFDDADIDQAINAAMASKFRNAGQTCVCADRFLVHSSVHDIFVEKLVDKTKTIQVGAGVEEGSTMGPLITLQAADSVSKKVQDAIDEGAVCELGGSRLDGQFFEPTILTNVSTESDIWKTETFGPVAPIVKFDTEEEALAISNDSPVGLASYFCTKDLSRVFRFSNSLESGLVGVNEGIISSCVAPFGGVKESGLGREGSHLGLAEYLETKYVFINS